MTGPGGAEITRRRLLGLLWCGDPLALDTMGLESRAALLALDLDLDLVTWARRVELVRLGG
jgi:hypothetical protein